MIKSGVYKILNTVNGKIYMGSSVCVEDRFRTHRRELRNNKHHSITLQRAWNLHGEDAFKFSVIEFIEDKTLLIKEEQGWMNHFNSFNFKNGYNVSPNAANCLGVKHTAETKAKKCIAMKGINTWSKGRKLSPEHIAKLKEARKNGKHNRGNTGKKHSPESIAKIKLNARRSFTKEHIEKIKIAKVLSGYYSPTVLNRE